MNDDRTTEQKLSDLQDRYNVLAAEHETLKADHARAVEERRQANYDLSIVADALGLRSYTRESMVAAIADLLDRAAHEARHAEAAS